MGANTVRQGAVEAGEVRGEGVSEDSGGEEGQPLGGGEAAEELAERGHLGV